MTLLVMIRHGPTAWTAERRIQGRTDVPLSPEGRAVVRRWQLPASVPDGQGREAPTAGAVRLCSPLMRALETARLLTEPADTPFRVDERLVEICYGAWEGRLRAEIDAEIGAGSALWRGLGLDFAPPCGESPRQVQRRLAPFLREIAAGERATIAVCHKGIIRALYAHAIGWDMVSKPPHRLQDGTAHVFRLSHDGTPALVAANLALTPSGRTP